MAGESLYEEMARLTSAGTPFVLATVVDTGGSSPLKAGAKLLALPDGTLRGTVGGGAIEHQVVQAARALLATPGPGTQLFEANLTRDLGMCCGGKMAVFLEKVVAAERLYVFGAGHVGKALASAARAVGFQVHVVDEREEWLTPERFPEAVRRNEVPTDVARTESFDESTSYACVMTHDHGLDQQIVEALLRRPLRYLGVIGSRRKSEMFRARLEAKGFPKEAIARMRSPMGVAIGALTAEEIAVSIVAELIAVRRAAASRAGSGGASEAPKAPAAES